MIRQAVPIDVCELQACRGGGNAAGETGCDGQIEQPEPDGESKVSAEIEARARGVLKIIVETERIKGRAQGIGSRLWKAWYGERKSQAARKAVPGPA